jgi:hypothetical protein
VAAEVGAAAVDLAAEVAAVVVVAAEADVVIAMVAMAGAAAGIAVFDPPKLKLLFTQSFYLRYVRT